MNIWFPAYQKNDIVMGQDYNSIVKFHVCVALRNYVDCSWYQRDIFSLIMAEVVLNAGNIVTDALAF